MRLNTPSRRRWIVAVAMGIVALALPTVLRVEHHGGWWERVPGWWSWFGAVGCAVIVLVSKGLGRFLQKPEDWYD